jgi:hypothetical protein
VALPQESVDTENVIRNAVLRKRVLSYQSSSELDGGDMHAQEISATKAHALIEG